MAKKDEKPMYGQVPLPQVTKESAERQARKRQLRQPPTLAATIPQARPYRMFKVAWGGLNKSNEIDTGQLSDASNIDMGELPYIVPCLMPIEIGHSNLEYYPYQSGDVVNDNDFHKNCKVPLGLYSVNDSLVAIFTGQIFQNQNLDRGIVEVLDVDDEINGSVTFRSAIDDAAFDALASSRMNISPHAVVSFNVYSDPDNITSAKVMPRMLIVPTFVSLRDASGVEALDWRVSKMPTALSPVQISRGTTRDYGYAFNGMYGGKLVRLIYAPNNRDKEKYFWAQVENQYDNNGKLITVIFHFHAIGTDAPADAITPAPLIEHATVHQSRLFSVGNNRVYASGYNDYADYTLDTSDEINESHAWMSTSQSNPNAAGEFTAIATYGNHVLLFREKFLQEVYGNKNPFRIVDIGEFGTIDQRSIREINGILYFVGNSAIYAYSGGMPRDIGTELGINKFTYAVAGRCRYDYYLYCEDATGAGRLLVYNTRNRTWTEHSMEPFGKGTYNGVANSRIIGFANKSEGLYALTYSGRIFCVDNTNDNVSTSDESAMERYADVDWSFETEFITRHNLTSSSSASAMAYSNVNIKHLKSIQLLADVAPGGIKTGSEQTVDEDDFNSYADNETLKAVWVPDGSGVVRIGTGAGKDGTNALQMITNLSGHISVRHDLPNEVRKAIAIRFRFKADRLDQSQMWFKIGNDTTTSIIMSRLKGVLYADNTSDRYRLLDKYGNETAFTNNEWYDIEIIYDQINKKYKIIATNENGEEFSAERQFEDYPGLPDGVNHIEIRCSSMRDSLNILTTIDDFSVNKLETYNKGQFKVYALYDGEVYEPDLVTQKPVYDSAGRTGRLTARIKLRNTAHYGVKLHVEGTGYVKLHEVELYVEDGGTPYLGTGDTTSDGSEWIE